MEWWKQHQVNLPEMENEAWKVETFEVPEKSLEAMTLLFAGRPIWPGVYTRLIRKNQNGGGYLVMSDTPAEVGDHLAVIRMATGRVLIHGLGLGMSLGAVLAKPEVTHVDVVEISQSLIDLVGSHYEDPRLIIHQGDALTFKFPKGARWDVIWHDIWNDICTDNWGEMKTLRRRYGGRCNVWQGCWVSEEISYRMRVERS